jgi:hypothetical protein
MSRILVNGQWYDALAETALYESDFERLVQTHAQRVFPAFCVAPFKCLVETEDGETAKADLALVSRDYRDWWIVEVELAHHPDSHVLEQVRKLDGSAVHEFRALDHAENIVDWPGARSIECLLLAKPHGALTR